MTVFQGTRWSVTDLLTAPDDDVVEALPTLSRDAADNIANCAELLATGGSLLDCWRFGIMQTIDDYRTRMRAGGTTQAAATFTREPNMISATEVNAAIASLAEYLARLDGWQPPEWCFSAERISDTDWYVAARDVDWIKATAFQESPQEFRSRRVYTTLSGLSRA